MKKWLWAEIIILVVVLLTAAGLYLVLPRFLEQPVEVQAAAAPIRGRESVAPLTEELGATWKVYDQRTLTAHSAFVYDCQEEELLHVTGQLDAKLFPASVTKLFTTYVILGILPPEKQITAGDALSLVRSNSSIAGIRKGDVLTVEKLIQAMLLPSGNDAACILAVEAGRTLAGDSSLEASAAVAVFMKEMNDRAAAEGLTGTHFVTPDGYHDPDHYTCLQDMITIGQLALSNETIAKYAAVSKVATGLVAVPEWQNTNWLVRQETEYYCPYAKGLKTGRTTEAGNCLVSAFQVEDNWYIIGVFGCTETADRFADTLHLLNQSLGVTN